MQTTLRAIAFSVILSILLVPLACQSTGSSEANLSAEGHYRKGVKELQKMNYSSALDQFDRALQKDPDYHYAYNQRGLLYIQVGNPRQAIRNFSRALKNNEGYTSARFNRGLAYARLGAHTRAISDFSDIIEKESDSLKALYQRGKSYLASGKPDKALNDFNRVLEDQFRYRVQVFKGIAYRAMEKHQKALNALTKAIKKEADRPLAYSYRAAIHKKLGNTKKAKQDRKKFQSLIEESKK